MGRPGHPCAQCPAACDLTDTDGGLRSSGYSSGWGVGPERGFFMLGTGLRPQTALHDARGYCYLFP